MPKLRVALVCFAIAATGAACGSSGSTPSSSPSAAAPAASQPSEPVTPAASPPAAAGSSSPVGGLPIGLSEWKVAVASTFKAGTIDFTITNGGVDAHELLVFRSDLDPTAYPTDAAGTINEEGAGVTLVSDGENIDPGGSQARTVDLTPGKYLFVCNIPGHFQQGMFTVVTVTP